MMQEGIPTLTTSDFMKVASKDGNVFFNQKTRQLDVRGRSFFSRIVTWIRTKRHPNIVKQEYKAATDSFINAVKSEHSETIRKYHPEHDTNEDDFNSLYEIKRDNTPLGARDVERVLARLNNMSEALKIANDYSNLDYCHENLMSEISKDAEHHQIYKPSTTELKNLGSRIKEAIIEEGKQRGGYLPASDAAPLAQKIIKEHANSQRLKTASRYSSLAYCHEQIGVEMAKQKALSKHYAPHPSEVEELSVRIKDAILSSGQDGETLEDAAIGIAGEFIREYTDDIIEDLSKQKLADERIIKEQAKADASVMRKQKASSEKIGKAYADAAAYQEQRAMEQAQRAEQARRNSKAQKQIDQTQGEIKKQRTRQDETIKRAAGIRKEFINKVIEEMNAKGEKLPNAIVQQCEQGKINSEKDLIRACNKHIADQSMRLLHNLYIRYYRETIGGMPKKTPDELFGKFITSIDMSPTLVTTGQVEGLAKQVVRKYVNSLPKSNLS